MIDRTIPYVDLYMIYPDLSVVPNYSLPEGYHFELFEKGDEKDWVEIEVSSGDIINEQSGYESFEKYYGGKLEELKKRCIFVVTDEGMKVGTATAFYLEEPIEPDISGNFHWLAVREEYKGKGLAKPLITKAMKLMHELGHKGAYLHSQTHTWLACKIYKDLGWLPYKHTQSEEEFRQGWEIVDEEWEKLSSTRVAD